MRAVQLGSLVLVMACQPIGGTKSGPSTGSATSSVTVTSTVIYTSTGSGLVEDRILQDRPERVDVLFVVQSTAGMAALQDELATNIPIFFDYFLGSGLDYHVGVVSADLDDPAYAGKLVAEAGLSWIDVDTPSPVEVFAGMVTVGEGSVAPIQALGAAYTALEVEREYANAGFYREDAALTVVVVGDGTDATDPAILDPAGFAPWFDALKTDPDDGTLTCLLAAGALGTTCGDTATALGGEVLGMEDPWTALGRLGWASVGLEQVFALSALPVPGTIEVAVEDVTGATLAFEEALPDASGALVGDWTYDPVANAIEFMEYIPNWESTVVVTYEPAP